MLRALRYSSLVALGISLLHQRLAFVPVQLCPQPALACPFDDLQGIVQRDPPCARGAPGAARATQATNAATPTRTTEEDQSPMRSPERRDAPGIERPIVAAEAPRV